MNATISIDFLRPNAFATAPPITAPVTSPTTTAVVTSSSCLVDRSNSSLMNSSAPAMFDRS